MAESAWPQIRKKKFTAITEEEHRQIVEREQNTERRLYYEMLWETGGSQADIASLHSDQVDLKTETISFSRRKLAGKEASGESLLRIGPSLKALLSQPLTDFFAGKAVAGVQPERFLLRLCQIDLGIFRPKSPSQALLIFIGESREPGRRNRYFRRLIGEDFSAPDLTAVMIDKQLIGFASQERQSPDLGLIKMKQDMTPEVLQQVLRVLPLMRQPIEVIQKVDVVLLHRLRDGSQPSLESGFRSIIC